MSSLSNKSISQYHMYLIRIVILMTILIVSACGKQEYRELPTLVVIETEPEDAMAAALINRPTLPPTWTTTPIPTNTPTSTSTPTSTETDTPTITNTPSPTKSPTPTLTATPVGDAVVTGKFGVNLRRGPSQRFTPAITLLETDTALYLVGISTDSQWYKVETMDGQYGWTFGELLHIYRDAPLPVIWVEIPTEVPVVVAAAQGQTTGGSSVSTGGNLSSTFSKVGDSITANQAFMIGYGTGEYDLGAYGHLQSTINHFSGSFARPSLAAFSGFNTAAMMDSVWATDSRCMANETPLACEYRVNRPSVAIIMLGSVDVQLYGANEFRTYLDRIIQYTIGQGIIPVLTTFPNANDYYPGESEAFNGVIRSLASQYQIPLIDLRPAAMALSDNGVSGDGFHLSQRGDNFIGLNGEQNQYGLTMRNFMTLQMLHSLR